MVKCSFTLIKSKLKIINEHNDEPISVWVCVFFVVLFSVFSLVDSQLCRLMALFCESLPSVCIYAFCMAESCPRRPQQQKTRRNVFVSWSFFAAVATQKNCGFPLRHTRLIYRFLCGVGRRTVFVGLTLKIDNRTARELGTHWVQPLPKAAHLDHKINLSIINTVIVINSPKTIPNSTICALHICVLNIRFSSLPKFWPTPQKSSCISTRCSRT